MKLRYKKLVIGITVVTLALSFFILTLIPTGGSETNNASDVKLAVSQNEEINKLIADYYVSKKNVDIEAMSALVSDPNQIEREKFTAMAAYVEDYQNIKCYVIPNEEEGAYRVYARYDMKLKNIDTLGPCLTSFYVTTTSDGKYVIYLSALDEVQEEFISSADENSDVLALKEEVANGLQTAIDNDETFKQFYQKLDKELQANASGSAVTG